MGLPVRWIEVEQVEQVRTELLALPQRHATRVPCKRAIELLADVIRGLTAKGYSRKEIAQVLTDKGLPVTETVLRSYLRGSRDKKPRAAGAARAGGSAARTSRAQASPTPGPVGTSEGGGRATAGAAEAASAMKSESASRVATRTPSVPEAARAQQEPAREPEERKSKFVMRNDTEDL